MFRSQSSSSSQGSRGSQGFGASLTGTLKYIGETIAQYTGLGSQSPPPSQLAENVAEEDDEVVLLPSPQANSHSQLLKSGAIAVHPKTGLKVRDYAYKNPLPPVEPCKCCETEALFARMAREPPSNIVVAKPRIFVAPRATTASRPPLRPLKRSKYNRPGFIAGLSDLDFVPPEYAKSSQNSNDSQILNDEERPFKRQRRLQRENTEPFFPSQTQLPSRSPGFGDAVKLNPASRSPQPSRNKPIWLTGSPRNVFAPSMPAAGPSKIDREALWNSRTPTPPYVPAELPKAEPQEDAPMEGIISTPTVTPQGSEVFSEWSGFSNRSSSASLASTDSSFLPSKLSPKRSVGDMSEITSRHLTPLVWNSRAALLRPFSGTPSETDLDETHSVDSAMSGATLVQDTTAVVNDTAQAGPSSSPYQLRPRPNPAVTTPGSPRSAGNPRSPRKSTVPRLARRRDISPTLSLTLARRNTGQVATSKPPVVKTRSTMSKRASERRVTATKPEVRRSPRTKARTAKMVLSSVLVPARPKRNVGLRSRVRC
ncbi:hypothetical protein BDY19DRAFT_993299 [Irpex rosettiformis]|uniref:Uncharacterized protein n=1 Tax=Irpex rosettiformis TaxID=378272 RepID=A0ACB8U4F7_9APHY|nr:hypothetical protein BDY19DRAFT_993299 [Irpex rosettiformis]